LNGGKTYPPSQKMEADMQNIRPKKFAYAFDPATAPTFEVKDGETVIFRAEHAAAEDLTFHSTATDLARTHREGHALTGPVAVKGARHGDVLQIDILETRSDDWGWGMMGKDVGQLPERRDHFAYRPCRIDPDKRLAYFTDKIVLPTAPFYGVMGVTPTVKTPTAEPGPHGGNMDCKELCPPATLYLPVFVNDALFLAGDGHAAQGDGEISIAGLECGIESKLKFTIRRDMRLEGPFIEKPDALLFLAFAKTLDEAAANATRQALRHLETVRGLSPDDACMLAGFVLDLRITQVVDPLVGVHAVLPKGIFAGR
jgi:acetamidase/formamidase